jgi:hypothetical protein
VNIRQKRRRAFGSKTKQIGSLFGSPADQQSTAISRKCFSDFLLNLEAFLVYPVQLELSWLLRPLQESLA